MSVFVGVRIDVIFGSYTADTVLWHWNIFSTCLIGNPFPRGKQPFTRQHCQNYVLPSNRKSTGQSFSLHLKKKKYMPLMMCYSLSHLQMCCPSKLPGLNCWFLKIVAITLLCFCYKMSLFHVAINSRECRLKAQTDPSILTKPCFRMAIKHILPICRYFKYQIGWVFLIFFYWIEFKWIW